MYNIYCYLAFFQLIHHRINSINFNFLPTFQNKQIKRKNILN